MENTDITTQGYFNTEHHKVTFHGDYKQYLGLSLYNILLTVLTLGIYYPWAKCAIRKFLWQETEIDGSRFDWTGTGREMFKGFIKAYLILGSLFVIINLGHLFIPPQYVLWAFLGAYFMILALLPLIIHGAAKYRLSRTSFRGIRFGYRGNLQEFYGKTALDFFLTIITFGIYGYWLQVNIRKYVMGHSRFGNASGKFEANGSDLFGLSILQGLLTFITFYIYLPWAIVEFFKFYLTNTSLVQEEENHYFYTDAKGGAYFLVLLKAFGITVITLGIGAPIGQLMIHKYFTESISLSRSFNFEKVLQTEEHYKDAAADDMGDLLDFDF